MSKKSLKRSESAKKANRTRQLRKEFFSRYPNSADIAQMVLEGHANDEITQELWVTVPTVAAVRANLARYTPYADLAYECNF
jgi:FixJ family two-component response regulator